MDQAIIVEENKGLNLSSNANSNNASSHVIPRTLSPTASRRTLSPANSFNAPNDKI